MKLVLNLVLMVSLVVGVVGAVTAYLPRLTLPDDALVGLTLNDPAGARVSEAGRAPIAPKGATLTPELLGELRGAGVERVRVKEFAFERWSGWWLFLLGCAGLAGGSLAARREAKRRAASVGEGAAGPGAGPGSSLAALQAAVDGLRAALEAEPDGVKRLAMILERVAEAQRTSVAEFIGARAYLVSSLGMGGFARLMDAFAAAERQINRAWSAAADEVEPEARVCLDRASVLIADARDRLAATARDPGPTPNPAAM